MRRKKKEEHVNHERWLVSYADFITLLFAFFVVMFAISQVDAKKLGRFVDSMNSAFDVPSVIQEPAADVLRPSGGGDGKMRPSVAPGRIALIDSPSAASRRNDELRRSLEKLLHSAILVDRVRIRQERRGIAVSLSAAGFFDTGSSEVKPEALEALHAVADVLKSAPNAIAVEGHTDDVPIATPRFASNWELSTVRATTIVRYLVDRMGYDPRRLSATGYAEFRPVADNQSADGRALNRRVDLVLLTESVEAGVVR